MALVWNPFGLLGIGFAIVAFALAFLVYRAAPGRFENRALATFLAVDGVTVGMRFGVRLFMDDLTDVYASYAVSLAFIVALLPLYLLIISTLETPMTTWLRSRASRRVLVALALLAPLLFVLFPAIFVVGVRAPSHPLYGRYEFLDGPGYHALNVAAIPVLLYSLVSAASATRRAPRGSAARQRAQGYLVAFGLQDALLSILLVVDRLLAPETQITAKWQTIAAYANVGIPLAFILCLGYAILRLRAFDIDLKLKRGLSRGTLAGIFLAGFFIVAAVAEQYLQRYGLLAGGVAVGLMVFALRPLERAADRVANAAMPGVNNSPEYLAYRKLQVYRATLENALEDGAINDKERAMLDVLARELGIRAEDAHAIEREVAGA